MVCPYCGAVTSTHCENPQCNWWLCLRCFGFGDPRGRKYPGKPG